MNTLGQDKKCPQNLASSDHKIENDQLKGSFSVTVLIVENKQVGEKCPEGGVSTEQTFTVFKDLPVSRLRITLDIHGNNPPYNPNHSLDALGLCDIPLITFIGIKLTSSFHFTDLDLS